MRSKPTFLLKVFSALIFLSTNFNILFAQQRINLNFSEVMVREDFREPNDNWPNVTTLENLFVVDKDEYYMHRRNASSPFALMLKWENHFPVYQVLASLMLGPMDREDQTIGVIVQVQTDGKGAFVMEVNKYKQVRVKQLVGNYYRYVTGTSDEKGWVKGGVKGREEYNEFDIRVNGPQVDFYLNKKFITSADGIDYQPGTLGIIIGADTKAKADFFYVMTTGDGRGAGAANEEEKKVKLTAQEELVKVKFELEQMKRALASKEIELKLNSERQQAEIDRITKDNDAMLVRIRQLQEFKDQLDVDIDGDVFLTLAGNLREELIKNANLEQSLDIYKDSLKIVNEKYRKFRVNVLDGAITKAEREKKRRDTEEAVQTTAVINAELNEKQWKAEQEKFEADRRKEIAKKIEEAKKKGKTLEVTGEPVVLPTPLPTPVVETKKNTPPVPEPSAISVQDKPVVTIDPPMVQTGKATPLPIRTRKSAKAKD